VIRHLGGNKKELMHMNAAGLWKLHLTVKINTRLFFFLANLLYLLWFIFHDIHNLEGIKSQYLEKFHYSIAKETSIISFLADQPSPVTPYHDVDLEPLPEICGKSGASFPPPQAYKGMDIS